MKEKIRQDFVRFEFRDDHGFIFYNFTFGVKNDQRMYAKCKICSSSLSWTRIGNGPFILKHWNNYHEHNLINSKRKGILVKNYLKGLPPETDLRSLRNKMVEKFKITSGLFYQAIRSI